MEGLILGHDFYVAASVLIILVYLPMLFTPLLVQNILVVVDFIGFTLLAALVVEVSCYRGHHTPGEYVGLNNLADVHRVYLSVLIRTPD